VFEDISDISDPGDLEFDEQQQLQQQPVECPVSGNHLSVKPIPRAMKTSTDSGHVDEGENFNELDEEQDEVEVEGSKAKKQLDQQKEPVPSAGSADDQEDQLNPEPSCSTSTASSYETVGPGGGHQQPTSDTRSVLSPEYLSADDLQLPEDEDAVKPPPPPPPQATAAVIITKASVDITHWERSSKLGEGDQMSPVEEQAGESVGGGGGVNLDALQQPKSACASPASSNGGVYSVSSSRLCYGF